MLTGAADAGAQEQFVNQPKVNLTGGRVTSFLTGNFQTGVSGTDFLYINAATGTGASSSITVGELLNSSKYVAEPVDQITFTGTANVAATLADFDQDSITDYAFALTAATGASLNYNLCVYYGTGLTSSFNGGGNFPAQGSKSGCIAFVTWIEPKAPIFSYIAAFPLTTASRALPQFLVEDSANNLLYVISNDGSYDYSGSTSSTDFKVLQTIALADGTGPIYTGDFDGDGNYDFIVNGQTNNGQTGTATVYFGNGSGVFTAGPRYTSVHSMLLYDMDDDGIKDLVAEGDEGVINIYKGAKSASTPFATTSEGTFPTGDGLSGNGGKIALISDNVGGVVGQIEILTTTAMGLSVFENAGAYKRTYTLKNIYNIGSGRTSFARGDFRGLGTSDLALDSPEGIAILPSDSNGDGGFLSSNAFPTYSPALSAVVGQFRTASNNLDVVAATQSAGTVQGRLLEGNGAGSFTPATNAINTSSFPSGIASNLWPNIVAGDFKGDGKLDIAYTLTGLPLPTTGVGLYVQYGNGDGTFQAPLAVAPSVPSNNTFYGASVVGDFNGDQITDIANVDASYVDTLLGQNTGGFSLGLNQAASGTSSNLVAAGYFAAKSGGVTKTTKQDLVALQGASLIPYLNSGGGKTFTPETALAGTMSASSGYAVSALLLADVNNDGDGDVIALYHNLASDPSNPSTSTPNWLYIWYGNGDGTFQTTPFKLQLDRNFYLAVVADMNNDGFNDLVLSDGYLVGILFNNDDSIPINTTTGNFVSDCKLGSCSSGAEEHYLAGQGINAIVPVALAGDKKMDLVVANGGVTIANPLVLGGSAQTSATLAVDPVVNTGGITVLMNNITTQPVTATLTASPEPSSYAATFKITATVWPVSSTATAPPQGTVEFYIDGTQVSGCAANLIAGATSSSAYAASAICTIPAGNTYSAATHTLSATYSGGSNYSALTFTGTHVIKGGTTTTTLDLCVVGSTALCTSGDLTSTPPPFTTKLSMIYGQTWNGVVTIIRSDTNPLSGYTELTWTLNGSTTTICSLQTAIGGPCPSAVGTTEGTSVGTNVITASYDPGTTDTIHTGSSSTVTIYVSQDTGTKVVINSGSPNPAVFGTAVTFTATVSGTYAAPTGTVSFNDGSTTLCPSSALTPSASGVTSTASCTTSVLPVGADLITASYAETTDFIGATSPAYPETITPPLTGSFNITVTPNPVTLGVGYGTLLTVTVTANNGFVQDVTLNCGNLPKEASCTFTGSTIAGGSGKTQVYLSSAAPHSCGTDTPYFVGGNGGGGLVPMVLPALAGLMAIFLPGRRRTLGWRMGGRWLRGLVVVLLTAGSMHLAGCSTCTDLGTKPGTYTFQVTGTAATTGEVESQTVTLTVAI